MQANKLIPVALLALLLLSLGLFFVFSLGPSEEPEGNRAAAQDSLLAQEEKTSPKNENHIPAPLPPDPSPPEVSQISERTELTSASFAHQILGSVIVRDEAGPLRGIEVAAQTRQGSEGKTIGRAEVDSEGRFAIGLPQLPDAASFHLEADFYHADPVEAVKQPDAGFAEIRIAAQPAGKIQGRVILPDGAPARGASVILARPLDATSMQFGQPASTPKSASCDGEGRFLFRGVPPGRNLILHAKLAGFGPARFRGVHVRAKEAVTIELRLTLEAVLAGTVRTEAGDPIEGAELSAFPWKGMGGLMEEGTLQGQPSDKPKHLSGSDGSFRIGSLAPGKFKIFANKDGFSATMSDTFALEAGTKMENLRIVLDRGLAIAGRVIDKAGQPVAGAKLTLERDYSSGGRGGMRAWFGGNRSEEKLSDAAGLFRFEGLEKGSYDLEAALAGTGNGERKKIRGGTEDLEIRLEPYGALSGAVLADGLGIPISKFKIALKEQSQPWMQSTVAEKSFEAKDGRFRFESLKAGSFTAIVSAEGMAPLTKKPIEIKPGETTDCSELYLQPESAIRGRVLAKNTGKPLQNANVSALGKGNTVWASTWGGGSDRSSVPSDGDGRFEIAGLAAGKISLRAAHAEFAPGTEGPIELGPGEVKEGVEILLSAGGGIDGFFYDENGKPISGASLWVMGMQTQTFQMASTDANGYFLIEKGLPPGTYQITGMSSLGDGNDEEEMAAAMVGGMKMATANVEEGRIARVNLGERQEGLCRVTGKVFAGGNPVSGAVVSILPKATDESKSTSYQFAMTDADGQFTLNEVVPGRNQFHVQRKWDSGGSSQFEVEIPDAAEHSVEFQLPGGSIRGRLTDARTGKALSGLYVTLTPERESSSANWSGAGFAQVATDEDGRYEMRDLRSGKYLLTAPGSAFMPGTSSGYGRSTKRVELKDEGALAGIDFSLRPGGKVEGEVLGQGKPIQGASVFFRNQAGQVVNPLSDAWTDEGGHFQSEGLEPGNYEAFAKAPGYAPGLPVAFVVREGETAELSLHLVPGTEVVARLLSVEGKAIEGASVQIFDGKGNALASFTGLSDMMKVWTEGMKAGEYPLGSVPAGEYRIVAKLAGYQDVDVLVQVVQQPKQTIELTLQAKP